MSKLVERVCEVVREGLETRGVRRKQPGQYVTRASGAQRGVDRDKLQDGRGDGTENNGMGQCILRADEKLGKTGKFKGGHAKPAGIIIRKSTSGRINCKDFQVREVHKGVHGVHSVQACFVVGVKHNTQFSNSLVVGGGIVSEAEYVCCERIEVRCILQSPRECGLGFSVVEIQIPK